VSKIFLKLLSLSALFLISSNSIYAFDPHATGSAIVSATVLSTEFDPPVLISPNDNSTTNNPREPLVWRRPSPLPVTPLHHYDLFLDGNIFASSISDSITSQSYYFYNIYRIDDTFYLEMTSDFDQGYHTWSVVAYDTSGTSSSSETRTFYIDSIDPAIVLEKVDNQTLNWSTEVEGSIPDIGQREILITTIDPLLTGTVEPYANMQIVLICPQNILNCQDQTWQGNYPSGTWEHRFYGLTKGLTYTVHISATDAGGNSTIFPEFYLLYQTTTPVVTATATVSPPKPSPITPTIKAPRVTPTSVISPIPTPVPTPELAPEFITPFVPVPPIAPTPPPIKDTLLPTPKSKLDIWPLILILLLVLGLPLHLFMTIFGYKIHFTHTPRFLFTLFFPFLGHKPYQTLPFATLYFYNPEKLDKTWQNPISDVNGFYNLKSPLLQKFFIEIICQGRSWRDSFINGNTIPNTCLFPKPEDSRTALERLQHIFVSTRIAPLFVALATSTVALIKVPNYFYLIYLYLSLQLTFSEYIYPKISK